MERREACPWDRNSEAQASFRNWTKYRFPSDRLNSRTSSKGPDDLVDLIIDPPWWGKSTQNKKKFRKTKNV